MPSTEELLEAYATIRRRLSVTANALLREIGLGTRQFIILHALAEKGEANVTDLAELSMSDLGTISRSISQLKKSGLIEKIQSKKDGRIWTVKLTSQGQAKVPKISKVYSELSALCFGHLKAQERNELGKLLKSVIENLESQ